MYEDKGGDKIPRESIRIARSRSQESQVKGSGSRANAERSRKIKRLGIPSQPAQLRSNPPYYRKTTNDSISLSTLAPFLLLLRTNKSETVSAIVFSLTSSYFISEEFNWSLFPSTDNASPPDGFSSSPPKLSLWYVVNMYIPLQVSSSHPDRSMPL